MKKNTRFTMVMATAVMLLALTGCEGTGGDTTVTTPAPTVEATPTETCDSLSTVYIGNRTVWIPNGAFSRCYNLKDVYFDGTEEEWNKIGIGEFNEPMLNATMHFNSKFEDGLDQP